MSKIEAVRPSETAWNALEGLPGDIGSAAAESPAFTSTDGRFQTGLWWRDPDAWAFERPYDEVAFIISGDADIELDDGSMLTFGPGDVLVTPFGTKGRWRIRERVMKCFAIYDAPGQAPGAAARVIRAGDAKDWVVLPAEPGDPNDPGEEWYAFRSSDGKFSTGVWKRVPETGPVDKTYDEVSCMIRGEVAIEVAGGGTVDVRPGDVLVTANGCRGTWRAASFVEKFWAVYHG